MSDKKHRRLQQALEFRDKAKERMERAKREVQEKCPHKVVAMTPFSFSTVITDMFPKRICMHCRLEETGASNSTIDHWAPRYHGNTVVLGSKNDRKIIMIEDRDKFNDLKVVFE